MNLQPALQPPTIHGEMKRPTFLLIIAILLPIALLALESGQFRLLSVTEVNKMILISIPEKKVKYLLDAAAAKITVDGKAAEFKDLSQYSVVNVKFELKKISKEGISLEGVASEIRILTPEQPKK
jgi:hypothetical protein